jgi:tRNA-specific adenosine deaminase 1
MDLQVRLSTTGGEAWTSLPDTAPGEPLRGHSHYSHLGYVRLKPGRSDSLPSNSRCCSDKLCVRQLLGSLLAVTEAIIGKGSGGQGYFKGIITPDSEFIDEGWQRAFCSRVGNLAKETLIDDKDEDGGYQFRPMTFAVCSGLPPPLVRPSPEGNAEGRIKPAPVSAVFLPKMYPGPITETLVNGVKQGHKRFGGTGASCLSKLRIWEEALDIARLLGDEEGHKQLQDGGYGSKLLPRLEGRNQAKNIMKKSLKNWGA